MNKLIKIVRHKKFDKEKQMFSSVIVRTQTEEAWPKPRRYYQKVYVRIYVPIGRKYWPAEIDISIFEHIVVRVLLLQFTKFSTGETLVVEPKNEL